MRQYEEQLTETIDNNYRPKETPDPRVIIYKL